MPRAEKVKSTRSARPHPYARDISPPADVGNFGENHVETRRPVKHVYQLLNPEPRQAMPSPGIVERELSFSPSPSPVPVSSSSEEESDDEEGHDQYDDVEDDFSGYEEHLGEPGVWPRPSFDRWRGEVDVRRTSASLRRSVANGLQSFLDERIAPLIRAPSSPVYGVSESTSSSVLSQQGRVRDSRSRNDFCRDPYLVLFYGEGDDSDQNSNLAEKVRDEFLEIQDNQVVLRMDQLLDWWLARFTLEGMAPFSGRMGDFLRFVRRHEMIKFSTNSFPAFYKDCQSELRPLGMHFAYSNGVIPSRTGSPWNILPANPTHIATLDACRQLDIDADTCNVFVVFAMAEISSPVIPPNQAPAISTNQDSPHSAFYVVPTETRSFLYTSTSLQPPATASWIRSYHNPPPRQTWDTEFADVALLLRKLQRRPYTTCYKHYAIVWFQHEMCKAMGLQAAYGSQGGMDDVADWLTEQKQTPSRLLTVKRSTIQNWKAKVYSNTESLYVKFKSFIEKGGRIPPESERLYITVKVWVTNDPGAMIERGGFYTNEESIAMSAKGSGHLGALTDEHFAAQVAAHLRADSTWWRTV
ncbi:uncharacterized protein EV420DRAFT_1653147 [Desarmillaria tabescens]|uniref:Uncharacterized protein n=1 Tax=Armillaria tabescens TaxID=1929756 RepID=A0AA39J3K6_ARMTA|nr:uncharacterized protein EV420DRAFT_1653147 [Desarmillaria tabescens]KAK0435472.1 hypothetical protein EV420DRAFT_1653147 [Desarmillaria tabescens]